MTLRAATPADPALHPGDTPAAMATRRRALAALFALLLLTAALLVLWGHWKPLDQDEVFVLQTDSVASMGKLLAVQRHSPISLDPMFYHGLGHLSVSLFGATAFGIRLPSLLGYLLMQVCLFFSAELLAGPVAGVLAAALPALSATLYYGVEARPYGVLLGLAALLLLSWQQATRLHRPGASRRVWLVLLALSLGLALNTHYFAVLLLLPLYGAELVRTGQLTRARGRFTADWPVIAAIAVGSAGIGAALPFQAAAGEFRKHYYNGGVVSLHAVSQSYRALFINYTTYPLAIQRALGVLLLVCAALLCLALWRRFQDRTAAPPLAEQAFLLLLAALPFAGFLLARFVTHSIEVRYVLPAIIGIAVLLAVAMRPWAQRYGVTAAALLLLLIAAAGAERIREERVRWQAAQADATVSPEVLAWLRSHTDAPLLVQNTGHFEETLPYLHPSALSGRIALLYSREGELAWLRHDTGALTAAHLQAFSSVPVTQYQQLQGGTGAALLVLYPASGWDWLRQDLDRRGVTRQTVGTALGGTAVEVQLPLPSSPQP